MTRNLKIALLQIAPPHSEQEALENGMNYCIQAAKKDADIILFPELWNTGYRFPDPADSQDVNQWKAKAISRNGNFVQSFQKLAKEIGSAISRFTVPELA